jgi:AcrR family transcriptional regulator
MTPVRRPAPAPALPTRKVGRAQQRGDRTRDAIIEETVRCINEEGFAKASANHIAERAGVTWGVIQYHFGDRGGLLSAVIAHGFQEFRRSIQSASVPEGRSRQRVEAVVEAAWSAFSSPASRASLEILISARSDQDPARAGELEGMARGMRELSRFLAGDGPGFGRQDAVVGELLWATLRGLVMAQMLSSRPIDSSRERALLVDLISGLLDGVVT